MMAADGASWAGRSCKGAAGWCFLGVCWDEVGRSRAVSEGGELPLCCLPPRRGKTPNQLKSQRCDNTGMTSAFRLPYSYLRVLGTKGQEPVGSSCWIN